MKSGKTPRSYNAFCRAAEGSSVRHRGSAAPDSPEGFRGRVEQSDEHGLLALRSPAVQSPGRHSPPAGPGLAADAGYRARVDAVRHVRGLVAFWDFVKRDGDHFAAWQAPGDTHDFRLDAVNYVRDYWGQDRAADAPLIRPTERCTSPIGFLLLLLHPDLGAFGTLPLSLPVVDVSFQLLHWDFALSTGHVNPASHRSSRLR